MSKTNFKKINSKRHQQNKIAKGSLALLDFDSMHKTIDRSILTVRLINYGKR
jgi:hypothetical protein